MGNEESQQGGAPGQQQSGAPGTVFGMGPPQQPPRFGGPQAGGPPRQMAPTGRPNLRPGGPGPPQAMRGAFPGGPGTVAPRPQQGVPVRPVQVGVQPWAEPPVQQPPSFRGPAPQPQGATPLRAPLQQQQAAKVKQQQQQQAAMAAAMAEQQDLGVDLSNLSEEEKARILSVMARAQDLDQDYERHKRSVHVYPLPIFSSFL